MRLGSVLRAIVIVGLLLAMVPIALTLIYAALPPVSTLMIGRWASFQSVDRRYVPYEKIAPVLIASVVGSEDAQFCRHNGIDWDALRGVISDSDEDDGPSRGASTIPMQTAKNLYLWPGRSYIRKGLELPLALMIDFIWSKRRLLEIYLNIAEWGDGIYGVEAAAQRHFGKSAASLNPREAALLATALPNPILRNPAKPGPGQRRRAGAIMRRAADMGPWLDCVR